MPRISFAIVEIVSKPAAKETLIDCMAMASNKSSLIRTEVRLFDKQFEPTTELSKAIYRVTLKYDENDNVIHIDRELNGSGFVR